MKLNKNFTLFIMILLIGQQGYASSQWQHDDAVYGQPAPRFYAPSDFARPQASSQSYDTRTARAGSYDFDRYSYDGDDSDSDTSSTVTYDGPQPYQAPISTMPDRNYTSSTTTSGAGAGSYDYAQRVRLSRTPTGDGIYNSRPEYDVMPSSRISPPARPRPATLSAEDIQANKLIELSYFSPEMQQAVLACVGRPFKVSIVTGKVQNIPTVAEIIASQPVENNTKLNALHAALEATRTAMFLAALNVAYDNPNYVFFAPNISSNLFMPSIDSELKKKLQERESEILIALKDNPDYLRWYNISSWIPTDLVSMFSLNGKKLQEHVTTLLALDFNPDIGNLSADNNFVTISGQTLKELIKHFDYKQKVNPQQAANLLFKQCFIAQQIFDNDPVQQFFPADAWPLYPIPAGQSVSASNYVFDRLEVIRQANNRPNANNDNGYNGLHHPPVNTTYAHTVDELCNAISQNALILPHNTLQAHLLFLRIRKAIQTAIFIANKNSNFYLGYILPAGITKYLDRVVDQLVKYDAKLSNLCKDQQLGATTDDLKRDKIWNAITLTAQAAVVIGTIATAIDYGYGPGTSAGMTANAAEQGAYYTGKAAATVGSSAVTIPLQVGKGVVTGVGSIATGVVKGGYNAVKDAWSNTQNPVDPSNANNSVSSDTAAASTPTQLPAFSDIPTSVIPIP